MENWNKADENGTISVPNYLDKLIDKVGMQIRLHRISGKNEVQTVCDIVYHAEKFMKKTLVDFQEWRKYKNFTEDTSSEDIMDMYIEEIMNLKAEY